MEMPLFDQVNYTRPDLEEFKDKVSSVRLRIMTSRNGETLIEALVQFQKHLSHFRTAFSVCNIRYQMNVKDAFYQAEIAFFEESLPIVEELSSLVYSSLLNVDFAPELKAKLGEMIFLKALNQKKIIQKNILTELTLENTLARKYDDFIAQGLIDFQDHAYNLSEMNVFLQNIDPDVRFEAHKQVALFWQKIRPELETCFDALVSVRTQIAQKLGYDSFVELGYLRMERYDYTPEDVASFRQLVVEYIVPLTKEIRRLQKERLEVKKLKYYDLPVLFPKGNPIPSISTPELHQGASRTFQVLFDKKPSFYDVLAEHNFIDLQSRHDKYQGAFCETLSDYNIPFVFANAVGLSEDVATLIHESGHAFAALRSADSSMFLECLSPTLETCEIHSMAMEYLVYPYLENFFDAGADDYRQLHMTESILFLPFGCMVDEFQHLIYQHPSQSIQERNQLWKELEEKYQPFLDYDHTQPFCEGTAWQKKGHIFTDPFYYIDYCLAQVVAWQLWDVAQKKPKSALKSYDQICQDGGNYPFLTILKRANVKSPFDEAVFKRVAYQIASYLDL